MAMKVVELRAALEARGEAVSGYGEQGAWVRRRLHTVTERWGGARVPLPGSGRGGPRGLASVRTQTFNTRLTFNVLSEILVPALL